MKKEEIEILDNPAEKELKDNTQVESTDKKRKKINKQYFSVLLLFILSIVALAYMYLNIK